MGKYSGAHMSYGPDNCLCPGPCQWCMCVVKIHACIDRSNPYGILCILWSSCIMVNFYRKYSKYIHHTSSVPVRYGVSFVGLTQYGLVVAQIWVNIASGNDLLPDGIKPNDLLPEGIRPLTKLMLIYHKQNPQAFTKGIVYLNTQDINPKWCLTHWGRDQIDAISQTTFWNAFSRMKMK